MTQQPRREDHRRRLLTDVAVGHHRVARLDAGLAEQRLDARAVDHQLGVGDLGERDVDGARECDRPCRSSSAGCPCRTRARARPPARGSAAACTEVTNAASTTTGWPAARSACRAAAAGTAAVDRSCRRACHAARPPFSSDVRAPEAQVVEREDDARRRLHAARSCRSRRRCGCRRRCRTTATLRAQRVQRRQLQHHVLGVAHVVRRATSSSVMKRAPGMCPASYSGLVADVQHDQVAVGQVLRQPVDVDEQAAARPGPRPGPCAAMSRAGQALTRFAC